MTRYLGLHTIPGFTRELLAQATPALEARADVRLLRAYTSFTEGKVVCEWEAPTRATVLEAYRDLGFPYDAVHAVEAICDRGETGTTTQYL